ncbi:MAG: phytanoyl-CoA dioxygenase family protein [Anaerolineales bacterium]|nr:phytanoyl-CoA dioxygenase family protein [Anaerolineales bacterium]
MAPLSAAQVEQFHREGYLVVPGLLDPAADLDPLIHEYEFVLDNLARELFARGQIASTHAGLPFGRRLIAIYRESGQVQQQYFDCTLHGAKVAADTPFWVGPEVFRLIRNPKLLDAVESIIGPEIYSNPVQHVRLKPPEHLTPRDAQGRLQLAHTPVHQDNGVITPDADETDLLTVWFPLWDATIENGCLTVWPGSHRRGLLDHCFSFNGLAIPPKLVEAEPLPLPMRRGDVLFLTKLTMHASLSNHSDDIRWSYDLRYNPIGQPTGRGVFPGFIARSAAHPETELRDPAEWQRLWFDTRRQLAEANTDRSFNRWDPNSPVCA